MIIKFKIMRRKVETSMKFFRQTKETKRKLSFFLALAMVISLLPVSPVVKAATQNVSFHCNINDMSIESITDGGETASGSAVVHLVTNEAAVNGTITELAVEASGTTATTTVITVSESATGVKELAIEDNKTSAEVKSGKVDIKVVGIFDQTNITIKGKFTKSQTEPTKEPTKEPATPTPTPIIGGGTVSTEAAVEIGDKVEVAVPADSVNNSVLNNLNTSTVYQNGNDRASVEKAINDNKAKIETSLEVSMPAESFQTEKKSEVTQANMNTIDGLKSGAISKEDFNTMVNDGVVLDIDLNSIITATSDGSIMASVKMSDLTKAVTVTISIPKTLKEKKKKKKGFYYVIRIHNGVKTIIQCIENEKDGKISFESDKFSTYIVTFKEGASIIEPVTPSSSPRPGNNNGYIPGPGQSSSPSSAPSANPSSAPSANPSGAPSANPSGAPSANPSGAPSANPSGAPTDPTNAPTEPTKAPTNPTKKPSASVKVGKKATISGSQYKVTAVKGTRTVQFTKGKKNAKKIVIPSTVKVSGKSYKVTTIAKNALKGNKKLTKLTIGANVKKIGANAFKNCSKLKSIVIKTTKLTKSKVGTNAFKGINAKATVKVPKAKVKAYKKIVKAKGAGKNVKVKK